MELTHINSEGRAKMVDVSEKDDTTREAVAVGSIFMKLETLERIQLGNIKKVNPAYLYNHALEHL